MDLYYLLSRANPLDPVVHGDRDFFYEGGYEIPDFRFFWISEFLRLFFFFKPLIRLRAIYQFFALVTQNIVENCADTERSNEQV